MTMSLIETVEVGAGGAASIEFTSIPQDGTDLVLKFALRSNNTNNQDSVAIQVNENTGSIYTHLRLIGNGSTVLTGSFTGTSTFLFINGDDDTSNTFSNSEFLISNYTSSSNKSASSDETIENNATLAGAAIRAHSIADTNPITSVQLEPSSGTLFLQYSTASLYKITAA